MSRTKHGKRALPAHEAWLSRHPQRHNGQVWQDADLSYRAVYCPEDDSALTGALLITERYRQRVGTAQLIPAELSREGQEAWIFLMLVRNDHCRSGHTPRIWSVPLGDLRSDDEGLAAILQIARAETWNERKQRAYRLTGQRLREWQLPAVEYVPFADDLCFLCRDGIQTFEDRRNYDIAEGSFGWGDWHFTCWMHETWWPRRQEGRGDEPVTPHP